MKSIQMLLQAALEPTIKGLKTSGPCLLATHLCIFFHMDNQDTEESNYLIIG